MVISTIIQAVCLIVIVIELLRLYRFFSGCKKVRCTVVSSKKVVKRRMECLTDEFYRTKVVFDINNENMNAILRTSTFCPIGQKIDCYYHKGKHIIFRKRDLRKNLNSSSLIMLSVSVLFVVLNSMFGITAIGHALVDNIIDILAWGLTIIFSLIGAFLITYSVYAFRAYRSKDVIKISAKVEDVIMKVSRDNENKHYTYYPIYSYTYKGFRHTVRSKIKHSSKPKKGSSVKVSLNTTKGNLVEFNDVGKSFAEGICLLIMSLCYIAVHWFLIIPI